MKKIKNNYTNFILTVIAVAMIGILFKGEIIKPAHAKHDLSGSWASRADRGVGSMHITIDNWPACN
tara:strand:- start:30 stop:227 length:198 start_codon:yes stop_codon:yes gene_type:complete